MEKHNFKISVIVPVFNAEKYLSSCIDSILSQTFTNFELLLIDDGSKDRSGEICDEYAKKDQRIRVFHKENGGAMSARAQGVRQSNFDGYVTFVDADDYLPVDALESLSEFCSEKYDIIIGRADNNSYYKSELTKEENRSLAITGEVVQCAPWGRLCRCTLFDDWVFDVPRDIVKGEDMLMNIRLAFKNQKPVKLVSKKVYCYSQDNIISIMHTFKSSIEYEEMFQKYRLLSIPVKLRSCYAKDIIKSQVNGILNIINTTSQVLANYQYVQNVISGIKTNNIYFPYLAKLKLSARSRFVIKLISFIEKFANKL